MRRPALLSVGLLLAASSLSAQSVLSIGGAGGVANEAYSTAIDTTGGTTLSLAFLADYLVVGGGGAGGTGGGSGGENTWGAGGGGAGGVLSGVTSLTATSFTVTVGTGGAAASYSASSTSNGASGTKSVFGALEALGGGGGAGSNNSATGGVGLNGASGGGGGGDNYRSGGTGTAGQGYAGGTSRSSAGNRAAGGGGGGAGEVGQIGGPPSGHSTGIGGNGGAGLASSITGSSVYYGGGGGGGGRDTNSGATSAGGTGGTGGGGAGSGAGAATSGTDGLGGGGGGSGSDGKGGDGGDGIVIVRYKGAEAGTGGTIASGTGSSAGYTLHTFSTVGDAALDLSALNLDTRLGSVVSSNVSGTGALEVNTVGTIIFTGSATHSGGTSVQAGALKLGNGGTSGSLGGAVTVASGATLEYNRSGDATFTSLSGAGSLTKKGSGVLELAGVSTFSGTFRHEAGVLRVASSSVFNGSSALTLAGGTLSSESTFARTVSSAVTVSANTTLGNATKNGELTLSGGINLDGATRVLTAASDVVISGTLTNGNLTKVGSGALTLSGDNSAYSGNITLGVFSGSEGGALRIGSANALGSGSLVLRNRGGAISSDGSTARTIANAMTFADTGYDVTLGDAARTGALTLSGNINLGGVAGTLTVLSDVTISGTISNAAASFAKEGAGTLTLSGSNGSLAPSNWFQVNAGKLRIGSASALGTGRLLLGNATITSVGSTARQIAQEVYFSGDTTLGDETDNGVLTFAGGISLSGTRTLTIHSDTNILGALRDGSLIKAGAAKLTLSGESVWIRGNVTVNEGTLVLDGTLGRAAQPTVLQVNSGATLGGSGIINGNLVVSGNHNPGNSPGIQTVNGNVTYNNGATITWELGANTELNTSTVYFDQIRIDGDLDFSGATTLNLSFNPLSYAGTVDWSDAFWGSNHSWTIFDVTGTTTGLGNLSIFNQGWMDTESNAFGILRTGASFTLSQVGSDIVLNYTTAVPEPSTYGLILGGLALAGAAIRRRKQASK